MDVNRSLELALRASEVRFQAIVDSSLDAVITSDEDGRVTGWNGRAEQIFGWKAEEILFKNFAETLLAKDRRAEYFHNVAGLGDSSSFGMRSRRVESTAIRKDGSRLPVELSIAPIRLEGGTCYSAFVRDLSEIKRSEEQLTTAVESTRIGFYEWDLISDRIMWRGQSAKIFGVDEDSFDGNPDTVLRAIHPDDRDNVTAMIDQSRDMRAEYCQEFRTVHPNGRIHWISATGRWFFDADGEPLKMIGAIMDKTDRKKLEEQFLQSQKMEGIGRLAGGIAHDFNNLLTAVIGYTELAQRAVGTDHAAANYLVEVEKAALSAADLTQQLLAFARKQVVEPRIINLNDLALKLEKMLQRLIGEHIDLKAVLGNALWNVKADPGQMEQVLINLAVNARDAMPNGGKLVIHTANEVVDGYSTGYGPTLVPGRYVVLSVSDDGCGMDAETASHIFEPFFTTKPRGKGTGLGLSTCYGIINQLGGQIWAYSEKEQGTTFKIYLPEAPEGVQQERPEQPASTECKGETILLVEDEPTVRELAATTLRNQGYKVIEAGNGHAALQASSEYDGGIDLAITDVIMPQMGGRELSELLAVCRPETKVMFTSGYTDDAMVHLGVLEADFSFLQKPFSATKLLSKVREVLDEGEQAIAA